MLAHVLLQIHNFHQIGQFCAALRVRMSQIPGKRVDVVQLHEFHIHRHRVLCTYVSSDLHKTEPLHSEPDLI